MGFSVSAAKALQQIPVFLPPKLPAQIRVNNGNLVGRAIEMDFGNISKPDSLPLAVRGVHHEQIAFVVPARIENQDSHNALSPSHGRGCKRQAAIPKTKPFNLLIGNSPRSERFRQRHGFLRGPYAAAGPQRHLRASEPEGVPIMAPASGDPESSASANAE